MIKELKALWHDMQDVYEGYEVMLIFAGFIYMGIMIAAFIIHFARGGGI